ncbi:hypothetical protein BKA66DRAFT_297953 [Pyrenochaeta sp. MPI-SDFR-AT-0127]|nr:hypothetical protein BKA66DRAFT_297953 [Pyrenochaeta sp. MPI-SDFR-AT-0127]
MADAIGRDKYERDITCSAKPLQGFKSQPGRQSAVPRPGPRPSYASCETRTESQRADGAGAMSSRIVVETRINRDCER